MFFRSNYFTLFYIHSVSCSPLVCSAFQKLKSPKFQLLLLVDKLLFVQLVVNNLLFLIMDSLIYEILSKGETIFVKAYI